MLYGSSVRSPVCSLNLWQCGSSKREFRILYKRADTLSLDKYELPSISPASKKPVMIFAFGGGFKGGDKADKGYIPYFEFLARNGFVVVSTDYRTTLKNLDPSKVSSPMDFIAALQHAIDTAVEDFYDATGFVITKARIGTSMWSRS